MVNDQDFLKLTGGLDKGGGGWTMSNTVNIKIRKNIVTDVTNYLHIAR